MICHEKYLHRDPLAIISNKGGNIHIHATIGALVFIVVLIPQGVFWLYQKQKPVSEFANLLKLQKSWWNGAVSDQITRAKQGAQPQFPDSGGAQSFHFNHSSKVGSRYLFNGTLCWD